MFHFTFIINRWANFYFFVQNLSQWHHSNRIGYNKYFEAQVGPFSQAFQEALKDFRKLHQHYPFGPNYFGQIFFFTKQPLHILQKTLSSHDWKIVSKTFSLAQPYFQKIYTNDSALLQKWKRLLSKEGNKQKQNKKIISILNRLYQTQITNSKIRVYLLLSAPDESGGGANLDYESITLEVSQLHQKFNVGEAIGILWHEMIHLLFEKKIFRPLLQKELQAISTHLFPLSPHEIVAASLFPRGILGQSFLESSPPSSTYLPISQKKTQQIFLLTKKWITQSKPFDKKYIRSLVGIFSK